MKRLSWALALMVALPLHTVAAQRPAPPDSALDAQVRELASHLRCPVCQGLSIQDSPTELAQDMKAVVRDQLARGRTPAEVRAYFVGRYGEWILLEPRPAGFNLLVYLLPVLALAGGAGVIVVAVRRWTRGAAPEAPPGSG